MSHILRIESTWDEDASPKTSWFYIQPGTALDAHESLVRRWREVKSADFTRDKKALTITRRYDHPELGRYTDVITHEDMAS